MSEEQELTMYERAVQLDRAGYQITILEGHKKNPTYDDWQNNSWKLYYNKTEDSPRKISNITGVGLIGGSYNSVTKKYVYIIDIDIYQPEKRDKVFKEIKEFFNSNNIYYETTPSGGYHIIFFSSKQINGEKESNEKIQKVFNFGGFNHKDKVEYFFNSQCLIAPSKAIKKDNVSDYKQSLDDNLEDPNIGSYKQTSIINLEDTIVLTDCEINQFNIDLKISSRMHKEKEFQHKFIISPEHRDELKILSNKLKNMYYCKPLYNGNKYNFIKSDNFEKYNLTGVMINLGIQKDSSYLVCLDFDNINEELILELMNDIGQDTLVERSVSGGCHIYLKTKTTLDVNVKWLIPNNSGNLDVLWMKNQTVNIAPTCSYTNNKKVSKPIYNTSEVLSGSFNTIKFVEVEDLRYYINSFIPYRIVSTTQQFKLKSEEDRYLRQHIYQYGEPNEIDRQIKLLHSNVYELLDLLNIKNTTLSKNYDYVRFFSLYADDGENPDAILFHNRNETDGNKWPGYSVQDFHDGGKTISFSKYLNKYSPEKFDFLMHTIGFTEPSSHFKDNPPISTTYLGDTLTIKYDKYISDDQYLEVMNAIENTIENKKDDKQPQIIITAPTGCGKTEMFYKLAEKQKIKMILALAYTSQVLQGKESHTVPDILNGMCEKDRIIPNGSIFMTYDKAKIISNKINPKDYIMVIDEAHNISAQFSYRKKQIQKLTKLTDKCKAVIYMTATPDYIDYKEIDLVIKLEASEKIIKQVSVIKYETNIVKILPNVILTQHKPNTIDVVYLRNIKILMSLEKVIKTKCPDMITHQLNAEVKNNSFIHKSITKYQSIFGCDILFTTNLIVDGVNINDKNIGNIYIINPDSTTDLIQFPARFRNGYLNYFIFITGNKPTFLPLLLSRQDFVNRYYKIGFRQKLNFSKTTTFLNTYGYLFSKKSKIKLIDMFDLLDCDGKIQKNSVLLKTQQQEARRMRWDIPFLTKYLEGDYNFKVTEDLLSNISSMYITNNEINLALDIMKNEQLDSKQTLISILIRDETIESLKKLTDDEYSFLFNGLIKDYLKEKHYLYHYLKERYNINDHIITDNYQKILSDIDCRNILHRICSGIDYGAIVPMKLIPLNNKELISITRTLNNLKIDINSTVEDTNESTRYKTIIQLIDDLKEKNIYTFNSDDVKVYIKNINDQHKKLIYSPNFISPFISDLHDIFDVKVKKKSSFTEYTVGVKWTIDNIKGISFDGSY